MNERQAVLIHRSSFVFHRFFILFILSILSELVTQQDD